MLLLLSCSLLLALLLVLQPGAVAGEGALLLLVGVHLDEDMEWDSISIQNNSRSSNNKNIGGGSKNNSRNNNNNNKNVSSKNSSS